MAQSIRMPGARLKNKKHTLARKKSGMRLNNWINRTDLCNFIPTKMNERKKEFLSPTL